MKNTAWPSNEEQARAVAEAALEHHGCLPTCDGCGKPVGWGLSSVQCNCPALTIQAGQIATGSIVTMRFNHGIRSDIPAMRERAERVKARARHKDLDGETARLLACDVLSLIEALEELA